jgi:putative drug exporter of the RND superfamily
VVLLSLTIKMLAVGVAVSVRIDASVVRMILVPAVMSVLGEHAWWLPRWLRWLPHPDIEGDVPASQPGRGANLIPAG